MDRGVVLYMSLDHFHPAESCRFHLEADKSRPGKDGDIRKTLKILFK